jgi:hypothetical protein
MADLTRGRTRQDKNRLGGNAVLYLFNRLDNAFTVDAATNVISAVNVSLTAGSVFAYDLENDGNTLAENIPDGLQSGTRVNTQTATCVLPFMTVADSAEFNLLVASNSQGVLKTRNGDYLALGLRAGMNWSVESTTGGGAGDLTGYTVIGTAQENKLAPYLDPTTITAFLLLVA